MEKSHEILLKRFIKFIILLKVFSPFLKKYDFFFKKLQKRVKNLDILSENELFLNKSMEKALFFPFSLRK